MAAVGCVVIGRNEGERLKRCIASMERQPVRPIVYVDSGSTDGSFEYAQSRGAVAIALDLSRPFTMGRARNTGFRELMQRASDLDYVQFVDGDCEVDDGWVLHARDWLQAHPELAAVCGVIRERDPHATVYNRLFDMELRGPLGAIDACGGVAMYRANDFAISGGFDERMIAGEEPELCLRLRRAGRGIWRIPQPMALHDADMRSFKQWWLRAVRCGHAYADGFALQGRTAERHNLHAMLRCLILGPLLSIAAASGILFGMIVPNASQIALGAIALLAVAWLKVGASSYRDRRRVGDPRPDCALYGVSCVVAKLPEALGVLKFARNRLTGRRAQLIEYRARRGTTRG
jgi:GT2 family glycosyltransferase